MHPKDTSAISYIYDAYQNANNTTSFITNSFEKFDSSSRMTPEEMAHRILPNQEMILPNANLVGLDSLKPLIRLIKKKAEILPQKPTELALIILFQRQNSDYIQHPILKEVWNNRKTVYKSLVNTKILFDSNYMIAQLLSDQAHEYKPFYTSDTDSLSKESI